MISKKPVNRNRGRMYRTGGHNHKWGAWDGINPPWHSNYGPAPDTWESGRTYPTTDYDWPGGVHYHHIQTGGHHDPRNDADGDHQHGTGIDKPVWWDQGYGGGENTGNRVPHTHSRMVNPSGWHSSHPALGENLLNQHQHKNSRFVPSSTIHEGQYYEHDHSGIQDWGWTGSQVGAGHHSHRLGDSGATPINRSNGRRKCKVTGAQCIGNSECCSFNCNQGVCFGGKERYPNQSMRRGGRFRRRRR